MPDASISCSFLLCQKIESGIILRKIATLAETGKMEGNIVSRVRNCVRILAAKYQYKLNYLFFARVVSRIRSIFVSIFRSQFSSILHSIRNSA